MTREELVQMREHKVAQASTEYYYKHPKADPISAFEDGVAWADEHPNNQLIKFADKKPQVGKRVIFQDDYFNHGEFYTAVLCEDGTIELLGIYEDIKIEPKASACWMPAPTIQKSNKEE